MRIRSDIQSAVSRLGSRTAWLLLMAVLSPLSLAVDHVVSNRQELLAALGAAQPGDQVLLNPGDYAGGIFVEDLSGVTIRSADLENRATITGGRNNIQLLRAQDVTISHLIFQNAIANGINIDDGGSLATPARNIQLRHLLVRDVGSTGNQDGIKLSGVNGFVVDQVVVENWGAGGSAVDMVGCHDGLIERSVFRHNALIATAVRPKGGTKRIVIRANKIHIPNGAGRALQMGGSTGTQYFRFIDGDSGYEASEIEAYGNLVIGANSAFNFVNIDGGRYHHNLVWRPKRWVIRILNENPGDQIVDTRNGIIHDNVIVFGNELSRTVNIGIETVPQSFRFEGNTWFNADQPEASTPMLPVDEPDATIGIDPGIDPDGIIRWDFPWGIWLLNMSESEQVYELADNGQFVSVQTTNGGDFLPLRTDPLSGDWSAQSADKQFTIPPQDYVILLRNSAVSVPFSSLSLWISYGLLTGFGVVHCKRRLTTRAPRSRT